MPAPPISASYTAPTSVLAKNLVTLRKMLANCTAFRTFAGAANEAEALARIYLGCLPLKDANDASSGLTELNNFRPFAIIGPIGNAIERRHISTGQTWSHGRRGEAMILMERSHPTSGDDDDNDLAWIDLVDSIVQSNNASLPGMVELHEQDEYLSIAAIDVLEIYRGLEEEKAELGDYQRAEIKVHWGRI